MASNVKASVQVPKLFLDYKAFPNKLFAFWAIIFFGLVLCFAQNRPLQTAPAYEGGNQNYSQSVSLGSPFSLSFSIINNEIHLGSGDTYGARVVKNDPNRIDMYLSDGTLSRSLVTTVEDETLVKEIIDGSGARLYKIKKEDEEIKIRDASGNIASKIKFKEDKFNIYGTDGKRTYYGKQKKGSILIRNDAGSDVTWVSSSSSLSLQQAAPLCLPLDDGVRALLFADQYL